MENEKKKKCYISCFVNEVESVKLNEFLASFGDEYHFIIRSLGNKDFKRTQDKIKECDIYIGIVTFDFLTNEITRNELETALELRKSILCLLTPNVEMVKNDLLDIDIDNDGFERIQFTQLVEMIYAMSSFSLPYEPFEVNQKYHKRTVEILEIKKLIDQIITETNLPKKMRIEDDLSLNNMKTVKWKDSLLLRGTFINNNNRLVIISYRQNRNDFQINMFDSNANLISKHDAVDLLIQKPSLISSNDKNEILIVDDLTGYLNIYDQELTLKVSCDFKLQNFCDMTVDDLNNDIYLVKCIDRSDIRLIGYNSKSFKPILWKTGDVLRENKFKPRTIKVQDNEIYIVNACSMAIDQNTREIKKIEFGESYIYVLDKYSFKIKILIDLTSWALCQPWSLIITSNSDIYTTVYLTEGKKYASKERYLCKISKYGDLNGCDALDGEVFPHDLFYLNNNFILFDENIFYIYQ